MALGPKRQETYNRMPKWKQREVDSGARHWSHWPTCGTMDTRHPEAACDCDCQYNYTMKDINRQMQGQSRIERQEIMVLAATYHKECVTADAKWEVANGMRTACGGVQDHMDLARANYLAGLEEAVTSG